MVSTRRSRNGNGDSDDKVEQHNEDNIVQSDLVAANTDPATDGMAETDTAAKVETSMKADLAASSSNDAPVDAAATANEPALETAAPSMDAPATEKASSGEQPTGNVEPATQGMDSNDTPAAAASSIPAHYLPENQEPATEGMELAQQPEQSSTTDKSLPPVTSGNVDPATEGMNVAETVSAVIAPIPEPGNLEPATEGMAVNESTAPEATLSVDAQNVNVEPATEGMELANKAAESFLDKVGKEQHQQKGQGTVEPATEGMNVEETVSAVIAPTPTPGNVEPATDGMNVEESVSAVIAPTPTPGNVEPATEEMQVDGNEEASIPTSSHVENGQNGNGDISMTASANGNGNNLPSSQQGSPPLISTSRTADPRSADNVDSRTARQQDPTDSEFKSLDTKIYIGGLPERTERRDLEDCFGQFGGIEHVELKLGYAFIEYTTPGAAKEAIETYNEGHFLGAMLKVEASKSTASQSKNVAQGTCFTCGSRGHFARECPKDPRNEGRLSGAGGEYRASPRTRNNFDGRDRDRRRNDDYDDRDRDRGAFIRDTRERDRDYRDRDRERERYIPRARSPGAAVERSPRDTRDLRDRIGPPYAALRRDDRDLDRDRERDRPRVAAPRYPVSAPADTPDYTYLPNGTIRHHPRDEQRERDRIDAARDRDRELRRTGDPGRGPLPPHVDMGRAPYGAQGGLAPLPPSMMNRGPPPPSYIEDRGPPPPGAYLPPHAHSAGPLPPRRGEFDRDGPSPTGYYPPRGEMRDSRGPPPPPGLGRDDRLPPARGYDTRDRDRDRERERERDVRRPDDRDRDRDMRPRDAPPPRDRDFRDQPPYPPRNGDGRDPYYRDGPPPSRGGSAYPPPSGYPYMNGPPPQSAPPPGAPYPPYGAAGPAYERGYAPPPPLRSDGRPPLPPPSSGSPPIPAYERGGRAPLTSSLPPSAGGRPGYDYPPPPMPQDRRDSGSGYYPPPGSMPPRAGDRGAPYPPAQGGPPPYGGFDDRRSGPGPGPDDRRPGPGGPDRGRDRDERYAPYPTTRPGDRDGPNRDNRRDPRDIDMAGPRNGNAGYDDLRRVPRDSFQPPPQAAGYRGPPPPGYPPYGTPGSDEMRRQASGSSAGGPR